MSFVFYLVAIPAARQNNEPGNAAKIILWYLPIIVEAIMHYFAISENVKCRVNFEAEEAYENCSSLFIIILGGGMEIKCCIWLSYY